MDHLKIYSEIIKKAKTRQEHNLNSGYTEDHHIIPKCLGGDDSSDNIVPLTAKEHFICHALLCYVFPDSHSLLFAFDCMSKLVRPDQYRYISGAKYSRIKEKLAEARSIAMSQNVQMAIENGNHITQRPEFREYSKSLARNLANNSLESGTHATQRHDSIRLSWLKSATNGMQMTYQHCILMGDKLQKQLVNTLNEFIRYHNILGIRITQPLGPRTPYIVYKDENFDPNIELDYKEAYRRHTSRQGT